MGQHLVYLKGQIQMDTFSMYIYKPMCVRTFPEAMSTSLIRLSAPAQANTAPAWYHNYVGGLHHVHIILCYSQSMICH